MSGDQKAPRGASGKGQGSKRARTSSHSPSAGRSKFPELNNANGETIKEIELEGLETKVVEFEGVEGGHQDREKAKLETDRYRRDTRIRGRLAGWACIVVSTWLLVVAILLGLKQFTGENGLSDAVLMMLLSTTTLNVLGISFIVLNGYFKSHRSSSTSGD